MTQQPEREPEQQPTVGEGAADAAPDPLEVLQTQLDERTLDLQRLQAEYVNYKRRVDRDRAVVRDSALAGVLTSLLPVLDDLDRAEQHGELIGGFKAVSDALQRTLSTLGLERFGEAGEAFDPRVHEALMHELSDDVDGPTARAILQPGYRVGDRVLRPARVAVVEPATAVAAPTLDEAEVPDSPGPVDADAAGPDVVDDEGDVETPDDEGRRDG